MKKNSSRIVMILDRSGSMEAVRDATADGFNEFVSGQRHVGGECRVRLIQFNQDVETSWDCPLDSVPKLDRENYRPGGNTALYDAMGATIEGIGQELAITPEPNRPAHVIIVVLTDGMENASRRFRQSQVRAMVERQRSQYSWEFVFLGANQDAVLTAEGFGIPGTAAMSYDNNSLGVRNVFRSTTAYANSVRVGATNAAFTSKDREDAMEGKK